MNAKDRLKQLNILIEPELLQEIDTAIAAEAYPPTRAVFIRTILRQAMGARRKASAGRDEIQDK